MSLPSVSKALSVAHRPGLEGYFDREIHLIREPGEVHSTPQYRPRGLLSGLKRLVSPTAR
jgi:hypothetical protein